MHDREGEGVPEPESTKCQPALCKNCSACSVRVHFFGRLGVPCPASVPTVLVSPTSLRRYSPGLRGSYSIGCQSASTNSVFAICRPSGDTHNAGDTINTRRGLDAVELEAYVNVELRSDSGAARN